MSDRRLKHRIGNQFFPHVLCLEDRTVPATFYVDPALAGSLPGATVDFNAAYPGQKVTGLTFGTDAFADFAAALNVANTTAGADTIRVAGSEDPIPLANTGGNPLQVLDDLTIQGTGVGATILSPTTDTATLSTGVIQSYGFDLTVTDLAFDANGQNVGLGFDIGDSAISGAVATFDRVAVRNIQFPDAPLVGQVAGIGIFALDIDIADTNEVVLNVLNSTVTNSGLHGISYENTDGLVSGTTVTGRGVDAFVNTNNGLQIAGVSTVLVTGSIFTGNLAAGVSSGIAVADGIDGSPTVTLIGNTLTGNTIGLTVGVVAGDGSTVTAEYNNIAGNFQGIDSNDNAIGVNAPNNWWGDVSGPNQASGNPTGVGNLVSDNVIFLPVLTTPTPVVPAATPTEYIAAISTVGVAITPEAGQLEPVPSGPVNFTVVFSQPVTGFDAADVVFVDSPGGILTVGVTGSGTTYTVTINGLAGVGEVAIQVPANSAITAEGYRNTQSGVASVDFGNTPPKITAIADQTATVGTPTPATTFTVYDTETAEANLIVTATSSNQAVVADGSIVLGGTEANRTISVTPGGVGSAVITVTVTDGSGATGTTTFAVTGTPSNTPPTISAILNQSSEVNTPTAAVPFTIGDVQTDPSALTVTATSSDQSIVPNGNIVLGGSGANRTIQITPVAQGTATITVTVTDGAGVSTTATFTMTGLPDDSILLGPEQYAVTPGNGGGPVARFFNADGTERFAEYVFDPTFTGGARTATGDFNGDGIADIAVGAGPGSVSAVRVINGANPAEELFRVIPFEESFTGGVFVAVGDLTGDGVADLVITPDTAGGPRVRVFDGATFTQLADFFGIEDEAFRGGARAAIGDVNGDGFGDLLVAAGFGGGPRVATFDGTTLTPSTTPVKLFADFFVFEQTLRNGVYITSGDLDGDGFADIIVGGGPGGGPRVFALSGKDKIAGTDTQLANFFAGDPANRGGVRLGAKNLDGDDRADLVTGAGDEAGTRVTTYAGSTIPVDGAPLELYAFEAFPGFTNGVYVG